MELWDFHAKTEQIKYHDVYHDPSNWYTCTRSELLVALLYAALASFRNLIQVIQGIQAGSVLGSKHSWKFIPEKNVNGARGPVTYFQHVHWALVHYVVPEFLWHFLVPVWLDSGSLSSSSGLLLSSFDLKKNMIFPCLGSFFGDIFHVCCTRYLAEIYCHLE